MFIKSIKKCFYGLNDFSIADAENCNETVIYVDAIRSEVIVRLPCKVNFYSVFFTKDTTNFYFAKTNIMLD